MAAVSSSDDSSIRRKRQRAEQKQPKQRQDPDPTFQESSGIQPKVAIPRIQQDDNRARKRRIKHACVACQQQKAKCSGGQPRCQRCSDLDLECCYSMGKRAIHRQYARLVSRAQARLINRMHERLEEQNNQAWGLLSLLRSNASPEDQQLIQKHLDLWNETTSSSIAERSAEQINVASLPIENALATEAESQGSADMPHEDIEGDEIARATGYLGKSSDIQWLRRAKLLGSESKHKHSERSGSNITLGHLGALRDTSHPPRNRRRSLGSNEPLSAVTYHLDDLEMPSTSAIDAYAMPTRKISHALLEHYKSSTNVEFPFIDVNWVADRISDTILRAQDRAETQCETRERAVLNIIFAIGASYAHLIDDAQGDEGDHFLYYNRARVLGLEGGSFIEHPDIQAVQIAGLTGFYYFCSNQINRAWMITGYAIRAAFALGLHVRNEDVAILRAAKRARQRLWWALWLLERQLVILSGRPTGIRDSTCSVPRPNERIFNDFTPPTDLETLAERYLTLRIDLAKLTQKAIDLLYSPSAVAKSWATVQVNIETLEQGLQQWRYLIPVVYDFSNMQSIDSRYVRETQTLGLYYYIGRIMVTRPCLCNFDRQVKLTKDSLEFIQTKAEGCVSAAENAIDLLPKSFDPVHLYKSGPWYSQVSLIMQAFAIIMLELSLGASHSSSVQTLTLKIEKVVAWLREMAKQNAAAYRAWKQCIDLLASLAPRMGMDMSIINMAPPEVNSASEERRRSVYPSTPNIKRPHGMSNTGEDHQPLSATLAAIELQSQQPEPQPWPLPFDPEAPLWDSNSSLERTCHDNDFFAFDSSLIDLLDFSHVAKSPVPSEAAMGNLASGHPQSTAASEQQETTAAYFGWEEPLGRGERR